MISTSVRLVATFTTIPLLFLAACATQGNTFATDDVSAKIILPPKQVLSSSHYDYSPREIFSGMRSLEEAMVGAVIIFPIYTAVKLTGNMMQEVEVYINPEGFGDKYRQRIVPGDNTIRLPREFALKGGTLRFEVRGTRSGNWTVSYIPNQDNNVIIIDPEQLKTNRLNSCHTAEIRVINLAPQNG